MENRKASRIVLQASTAETVSGNSTTIETGEYTQAFVTLNCTAASGTSPTLLVQLQGSDDGGTTWYNIPNAAFTQLTAAGTGVLQLTNFPDFIRAAYTLGGTTPSFTFAIKAVLKG